MSFGNVSDPRLRSILENGSVLEDDLDYSLHITSDALSADEEDEDVSSKVLAHRRNAKMIADAAWEAGNMDGVIRALGDFWSY
ncbi:hypothetical protein [Sphingomonas sp. BAUL-RG-20F-R05-02]|uniref:hypothetical protein n=1 Tax=Sphingomonas sp. BAUL-RG-20F-R05-02 TaxID=2914830 RepID=UPI001F58D65B|nr:hypothetical protein [Sphingomonas sp. BAUL-RG-20F-R05-02]